MKLLVVDDHTLLRAGLRHLLGEAFPEAEIGEAGDGRKGLELFMEQPWDVVLLDLELPDRDGLDVLRDMKAANAQVPVLILSGKAEGDYGMQALKAGAAGFVAKTEAAEALAEAIRKVRAQRRHVSPELAERLARSVAEGGERVAHEALSAREFQILVALGSGRSVTEIAEQLSLSVKTVSTYRTRVLKKMRMNGTAQLMRYALQQGLAE